MKNLLPQVLKRAKQDSLWEALSTCTQKCCVFGVCNNYYRNVIVVLFYLCVYSFTETESHCVAQVVLELTI